jgi:type II secretory pathway component PulC
MARDKGEKVKIVLVLLLSLVLVISFYFRFIHAKVREMEQPVKKPAAAQQERLKGREGRDFNPLSPLAGLKLPPEEGPSHPETQDLKPGFHDDLQTAIRDIFMPLLSAGSKPPSKEIEPEPDPVPSVPEPLPSFTLKGTIVGKKGSIAIIDDQFLRPGDWIGEFQVAEIRKKDVLLDSGKRKILLEIMKNE